MNDLVNSNDLSSIVKSVLEGTATEEQQGIIARQVQINLSATLVSGMQTLYSTIIESTQTLNAAQAKLAQRLETEADVMSIDKLASVVDNMQSQQLKILDLYRRIVNGKELFPQGVLSEEEKQVVKLLNSFSSKEEKQKFLKVVKETLSVQNNTQDEFED